MTERRLPAVRGLLLAGLLLLAGPVRAQDDDADVKARQQHLAEILLAEGKTREKAERVHALAKLDREAAAKAFVELLARLSTRTSDMEEKVEKTREKDEPYSGFSFTDPKGFEIKKRLRAQLDREEGILQSDAAVAYSFLAAISEFKSAETLDILAKAAVAAALPHSRRVLYGGLIRSPGTDAEGLGKKGLRDSNPGVRLFVLDAFAARKEPATVPLAIKALKEKGWPHRQSAARALGAMGDVRAVAPLINAMGVEEGRLVEVYGEALNKITGEQIGPFPEAWKHWFDENRAALVAKGAKGSARTPKKRNDEKVNYYGLETRSKRIVFIIDVSGSMKEIIGQPSGAAITGVEEDEETYEGMKIEIAKRMLKQAIRSLPDNAYFTIIVFNHEVKPFSGSMLEAKQDNKNKAYLMINDLEPSGATYTYGALKESFEMAGRGVTDKSYDPGVDTIFLLSDGAPTDDDIDSAKPMEGEKILAAVKEWNQLKRVQIHTIAIDPQVGAGTFIRFMKSLAARNSGTYKEIGNK
jgi:hypothetical protein